MFSRTTAPTPTIGQSIIAEAKILEDRRATAMKTVPPYIVQDAQTKIRNDISKIPTQRVFVYLVADILKDTTLYSKGYFEKACGTTDKTPTVGELTIFANAIATAATNQDYEVRIGSIDSTGITVTIDFTNTTTLAEQRIADEVAKAKTIADEAANAKTIATAVDKIAQ